MRHTQRTSGGRLRVRLLWAITVLALVATVAVFAIGAAGVLPACMGIVGPVAVPLPGGPFWLNMSVPRDKLVARR